MNNMMSHQQRWRKKKHSQINKIIFTTGKGGEDGQLNAAGKVTADRLIQLIQIVS